MLVSATWGAILTPHVVVYARPLVQQFSGLMNTVDLSSLKQKSCRQRVQSDCTSTKLTSIIHTTRVTSPQNGSRITGIAVKGIERLTEFTHETFAECLGDKFIVNQEIELELIEVTQLGTHGQNQVRVPFSLVFKGDRVARIPSGIQQVQHPSLQEFPLSMNIVMPPTNQQGDSQSYYYYASIFA